MDKKQVTAFVESMIAALLANENTAPDGGSLSEAEQITEVEARTELVKRLRRNFKVLTAKSTPVVAS